MTTDREHLIWIHERLCNVHDENPQYDYMTRLRAIIGALSLEQESQSNISIEELQERTQTIASSKSKDTNKEDRQTISPLDSETQYKIATAPVMWNLKQLPTSVTPCKLSNTELQAAIIDTEDLLKRAPGNSTRYMALDRHLGVLLAEQECRLR